MGDGRTGGREDGKTGGWEDWRTGRREDGSIGVKLWKEDKARSD